MTGQQEKRFRLCVVSPNSGTYSETFIRAHIERLPAEVTTIYGRPVPLFTDGGLPLASFPLRFGVCLAARLMKTTVADMHGRVLRQWPEKRRARYLKRFFRKRGFQAVLAEFGTVGVSVMNACQIAQIPLIVHFHGRDAFAKPVFEKEGKRYPELFNIASAVIAVSKDMEHQLASLGANKSQLYYLPYGIDAGLFEGGRPVEAEPVFVAVGRFVPKKAPHLTLMAFEKTLQKCPKAELIMVGDGPLLETCRQFAKALKVSRQISFPGVLSHREVSEKMKQARAFVQHSIRSEDGDCEGTPLAVLEAGGAGLPVVATRHGGIKDVVIEGKTGFLVDEGDVDGMSEHMIRLANDPKLAETMGKAAREHVLANYSMEKNIQELWRIIQKSVQEYHSKDMKIPSG